MVVGGDDAHRLLAVVSCQWGVYMKLCCAATWAGWWSGGLGLAYHLDGLLEGYRSWRRGVKLVLIRKNKCVHAMVVEKTGRPVVMSFAWSWKLKLRSWAVSKGCWPLKLSTGRLPSCFA